MNHEYEPSLSPVGLNPDQRELCREFERLHRWGELTPEVGGFQQATPTEMFVGALFVSQRGRGNNPDWVAQAAHSLREILYPFRSQVKDQQAVPKDKLEFYRRFIRKSPINEDIEKLWNRLNKFAHHHRTIKPPENMQREFEDLLADFEATTRRISTVRAELYGILDLILRSGPSKIPPSNGEERSDATASGDGKEPSTAKGKEGEQGTEAPLIANDNDLHLLLEISLDARMHFFGKADGRWLDWFSGKGFFGRAGQKGTSWSGDEPYVPEASYLFRMASEHPERIADIICGIMVDDGDFAGRAVSELIWVSSRLPASELARVIPKIRDDGWVSLLAKHGFRHFQHHQIVSQVDDAGLLALAEAMLTLRPKESLERGTFLNQNPFCVSDLSYGRLFHRLAKVGDHHVGRALSLVLRTFVGIVERRRSQNEDTAFEVFDNYFLPHVDFFTAPLDDSRRTDFSNDMLKLSAVLRKLATQYIANLPSDHEGLAEFHQKHIDTLPDSWAMWRVRLFFWELAPDFFRERLREAMFRIFKHAPTQAGDLVTGAEYLCTLGKEFERLSPSDRRAFFRKLCENAQSGYPPLLSDHIFTMIHKHLASDELVTARILGITAIEGFTPRPMLGQMIGEPRLPKRPMSEDGIRNLPIPGIVTQLKTDWSPDALKKSGDGTSRSPEAAGVGHMLEQDMRERPDEYARCADLFFDRGQLDPHYTYTYLEEMQQIIRNNQEIRPKLDGDAIVACCHKIVKSDDALALEIGPHESSDGFIPRLQSWPDVLFAVAGIVCVMVRGVDGPMLRDLKVHRGRILDIISHLLSVSDPRLEDDNNPASTPNTASEDPLTLAMNTARGISLVALVALAHQEVKPYETQGQEKLADDIRELIESTLGNTTTEAIMSVYGRRFLSLCALNESWGMGLLDRIFPKEPEKQNLFEAAWIGYLRSVPSMSIQSDPRIHELYSRGMQLMIGRDSDKKLVEEPSEGLACHLARFFVWCPEFDLDHPIHKFFWTEAPIEFRGKFVRMVGEMACMGDAHNGDEPNSKLYRFWETAIDEEQPSSILEEFGYWINTKRRVIEIHRLARLVSKTLKATDGGLSRPIGLEVGIVDLAKHAPKDTLKIARYHLFWSGKQSDTHRPPVHSGSEWYKAVKVLLEDPKLRKGTTRLVKDLVTANNQKFRPLMDALSVCGIDPAGKD